MTSGRQPQPYLLTFDGVGVSFFLPISIRWKQGEIMERDDEASLLEMLTLGCVGSECNTARKSKATRLLSSSKPVRLPRLLEITLRPFRSCPGRGGLGRVHSMLRVAP